MQKQKSTISKDSCRGLLKLLPRLLNSYTTLSLSFKCYIFITNLILAFFNISFDVVPCAMNYLKTSLPIRLMELNLLIHCT